VNEPITELAARVRAGLLADEQTAKALLGAARMIGKTPNFFGAGGPAAEALWQRFTEGRVLADVAAKRALLDEALDWEHGHAFNGEGCPVDPCLCGRDERVRAVLTLLAQPYRDVS
jgi:hypothetical protein